MPHKYVTETMKNYNSDNDEVTWNILYYILFVVSAQEHCLINTVVLQLAFITLQF